MRIIIVLGGAAAVLLAAGCGGGARGGGPVRVVAAENAYGDIAAQIGGRHVAVTSILSAPDADPHLFEPATRTGLEVARAQLVVENGAGYDAFASRLVASTASRAHVLTIADALGVDGPDANPHLWYDVPALGRIGAAIAAGLERADPRHAAAYRARLARFRASLAPLRREVAGIRSRFGDAPVAYTESVPGYLVAAAGLRNLTPPSFTRAIENGTEPDPQALSSMDDLLAHRRVRVLLYNAQAVSPITQAIRRLARQHGIPVVAVTETLPRGQTFQQWQLRQARALAAALAR